MVRGKTRGKIREIKWTWSTDTFYGRYENGDIVTLGGISTRRLTSKQKEKAIKNAGTWIVKPK